MPVVYDAIEEVAARALAPTGEIPVHEGRSLRALDRSRDAEPAETVPARSTALRRDRAATPLLALERPATTEVGRGTPAPGAEVGRTGTQVATAAPPSGGGRATAHSEWELLEELILAERVRVLADRMAREARAQDPSDPLRATRARIA